MPRRRRRARMIPFTALRNFEFFSRQASAAARSKPESCLVGASNLLCGLGGGWSGDSAAWRSNFSSSWFGRLWGGDPALSRRNDITRWLPSRRRRVYSFTQGRLADLWGCPVGCDVRQRCARYMLINAARAATSASHARFRFCQVKRRPKFVLASVLPAASGKFETQETPSPRRTHKST